MEAESCSFQKNVRSGVVAAGAAEVVVRACHSTENGLHGSVARRKATMTASDCSASVCSDYKMFDISWPRDDYRSVKAQHVGSSLNRNSCLFF